MDAIKPLLLVGSAACEAALASSQELKFRISVAEGLFWLADVCFEQIPNVEAADFAKLVSELQSIKEVSCDLNIGSWDKLKQIEPRLIAAVIACP